MYLLVDAWESWKDICTTVHTVDLREGAWWLGSRSQRGKRLLTYVTPWTVACWAPQSMGFLRQGYCRGLQFPPPRDLPNPRIELRSLALQTDSLMLVPSEKPCIHYSKTLKMPRTEGVG